MELKSPPPACKELLNRLDVVQTKGSASPGTIWIFFRDVKHSLMKQYRSEKMKETPQIFADPIPSSHLLFVAFSWREFVDSRIPDGAGVSVQMHQDATVNIHAAEITRGPHDKAV